MFVASEQGGDGELVGFPGPPARAGVGRGGTHGAGKEADRGRALLMRREGCRRGATKQAGVHCVLWGPVVPAGPQPHGPSCRSPCPALSASLKLLHQARLLSAQDLPAASATHGPEGCWALRRLLCPLPCPPHLPPPRRPCCLLKNAGALLLTCYSSLPRELVPLEQGSAHLWSSGPRTVPGLVPAP